MRLRANYSVYTFQNNSKLIYHLNVLDISSLYPLGESKLESHKKSHIKTSYSRFNLEIHKFLFLTKNYCIKFIRL